MACKPEAAVDSPPAAPDCEDDTDGGPTVDSADPGPVAAAGRALIWARIRTAEGERSVPWRGVQVFVEDSSGRIAEAALTDLHGAVRLPLQDAEGRGLAPGPARLWVEKDGMRLEAAEGPTLGEEGGHLGAFTVDLPEGAVAGRLALRDGSPCIWSFPEFEVEGEGRVWAVDGEGATLTAGALAADGSFVLAPSSGDLRLSAECGAETVEAELVREGAEAAWVELTVANDAPLPLGIAALNGDQPGEVAEVGDGITLQALAEDDDHISWVWRADAPGLAPDGEVAQWPMADAVEQTAWALGDDGRGGFVLSSVTLRPAGLPDRFSLRVLDPEGAPVEGATVTVDGMEGLTDADGRLVLEVLSRAAARGEPITVRVGGEGLAESRVDLHQNAGDLTLTATPCEPVAFDPTVGGVLQLPSDPEALSVTVLAGTLNDESGRSLTGPMTACLAVVLPEDGLPVPLRAKGTSDDDPRMPAPAVLAYVGLSLDSDPKAPVVVKAPGLAVNLREPADLAWPEGTRLSAWSLESEAATWTTSTAKAEQVDGRLATTVQHPGWVTPAPTEAWGCVPVWADRLRLSGGPYMLRITYTSIYGTTLQSYLPLENLGHQIAPVAANTTLLVDVVDLSVSTPNGPAVPGWSFSLSTGRGRRSDPMMVSMDETCGGDALVLPPSAAPPTGLDFLSRFFIPKGYDSAGNRVSGQDIAYAYYNAVDPDGSRRTLLGWLNTHGLAGAAPIWAGYTNDYDLGFFRAMRGIRYTGPNGPVVAMIVTNFTNSFVGTAYLNCLQTGSTSFSCNNLVRSTRSGGTISVAMEYSADNPQDPAYTRFFVYGPDGLPMTEVDLDGRGPRAVPGVCMNCHGGNAPGGPIFMDHVSTRREWPSGDVGARFLPFALDSYVFDTSWPSGSSYPGPLRTMNRSTQEPDFRALNELVLETNLTDAGRRLVHGWYGSSNTANTSLPAVSQDSHWIPPGNGQTGWDAQPELYDGVVRPYCRGCHLSFPGLTWENSDMLEQMGYMVQYDVCDRQVMPHALRTWDKMWRSDDPHAPGVLLDELPGTGSWNATACPY